MRELEFRGKVHGANWNRWKMGSLMQSEAHFFIVKYIYQFGYSTYKFKVIPETVGQYIGLKDKNGAKIFEGDIVSDESGGIGEVHWHTEHACFYWGKGNTFVHSNELMVIGNIHDNAELLEEANDE